MGRRYANTTAARKAPRFRSTQLCSQHEDRRAWHRLGANDPRSCLTPIQLVGQFDTPQFGPGGRDLLAIHELRRKEQNRPPNRGRPIQILEAKANQTRFRKQIDIRTFAYHV
jgi:hypothetical protein